MTRNRSNRPVATLALLGVLTLLAWLTGLTRLWADEATQPKLTKTAYGADGQPLTVPVNVGDTVNYVLNVKVPIGSKATSAAIKDVLSPSQKYVAPTLKMPAGWSAEPVLPYSSANTTDYETDDVAASQSLEMTVGTASTGAGAGVGDGFIPVPLGNKIFAISHHMPGNAENPMINCWDANTFALCAGYPKQMFIGNDSRSTSTMPDAAIVGTKIYYVSIRYDIGDPTKPIELGIGCWDTSSASPCPFIPLPGNPTIPTMVWGNSFSGIVAGLAQDPSAPDHLIALAQDKVYCVTAAGAVCAGWSSTGNASLVSSGLLYRDMLGEVGSGKQFYVSQAGRIGCHKYADGSPCSGWPNDGKGVAVSSGGKSLALSPIPDSTDSTGKTWKAVCLHRHTGGAPGCVNVANGSAYAAPFGTQLNTSTALSAFQFPNSLRVLYPGYEDADARCFDFGTNTLCAGYTTTWDSDGARDYGYSVDPANPEKCFLAYGHFRKLIRFYKDGRTDPELCRPETYRHEFNLKDHFCHAIPEDVVWDKVVLSGAPANLQGTIVLTQGSSTTTINLTPGTSTYEINIPAAANNGQLTLAFTPSSSTPVSGQFKIKLLYDAPSGQQICYQAKVDECGEVFNDATLTSGGKTSAARVDLGKAVGPDCPAAADCLKLTTRVQLNVNGVATVTATQTGPDGFIAEQFDVVSLTSGVFATANGPSWQLSGVTPGQSVTLNVNGTRPGAGPNGTDICCETKITVTIPTTPTEPDDPVTGGGGDDDDEDDLDFGIEKGGEQRPDGSFIWHLIPGNFKNATATLPANTLVVTDTIPAGWKVTAINAPPGWDCGPASQFPVNAGGTITCTYTLPVTLGPGEFMPMIQALGYPLQPVPKLPPPENCAKAKFLGPSGLTQTNTLNDEMCFYLPKGNYWKECDLTTTKSSLYGGCLCRDEDMTRVDATHCACPAGQVIQGNECVPQGSGIAPKPPTGPTVTPVPQQPVLPPAPKCDRATATLDGGRCVCKFDDMTRKSDTACQCKRGFEFDKSKGCVKEPPDCDQTTTKLEGDRCVCRYPNMRTAGKLRCSCTDDQNFVPGVGCVKKPPVCDAATAALTGQECACRYQGMLKSSETACACPAGSTFEAGFGCVPVCPDEKMTLNAAKTKCECPKGYELKENKCEKESSFRFNFGIDVIPGRSRPSPGPSPTPTPTPGRP